MPFRSPSSPDPEQSLRDKILEFVYQDRFKRDIDRAKQRYFPRSAFRGRVLVLDEAEIPGFQEWYVHDYVGSGGQRLIDRFAAEVGPTLPAKEGALLAAWLEINRLRLFEVQSIQTGVGVVVQDLLSGETLSVDDRTASRAMNRWAVILARPSQATDRVCFSGTFLALSPMHKRTLLDAAQKLWTAYRLRSPNASLSDFYRDHSLDLLLAMRRIHDEASRPPAFVTPEGHPFVVARAEFAVREAGAVWAALQSAEEFVDVGPSENEPGMQHFVWLLRGRSHVPKAAPAKGKGVSRPKVMHRSDWLAGSGEPPIPSLGDIKLWPDRLELECTSRQRLIAGKALLAELLGRLVRHRRDHFQTIKPGVDKAVGPRVAPPGRGSAGQRDGGGSLPTQEAIRQYTLLWLDEPGLRGDISPRQAIATPDGRTEVLEVLKQIEYMAAERAAGGLPPTMDVALVRRELGLDP